MLCSMEYIQGIMGELRRLLSTSALPPEERLRVLLTAAELVQAEVGSDWQRGLFAAMPVSVHATANSSPFF